MRKEYLSFPASESTFPRMLLNQDTLKFVFGMKLRGLRLDKGMSLKELSKKTGLSPSYINEIEKGKKYPKSEKIMQLAEALGERFEDLISLELKRELQLVQNLIDKKFLTGIPFDLFGVPASIVFELLSESPKKMEALVGTILEIARAHNIQADDFMFALLRSYISMHGNYFPDLEASADEVGRKLKLVHTLSPFNVKEILLAALAEFKVKVEERNLSDISPEFSELFYFVTERGKRLYLSNKLDVKEQVFILARELGFQHLKLKERTQSSLLMNFDSFDQILNHFSASYFASSLLIPEKAIVQDLQFLFAGKEWEMSAFEAMLDRYPCSYENFFHRLTQLLPQHFALKHLFFLRYEYDDRVKKYEISRELHLSEPHDPHKVIGNEHYCSRWLIHKLTQEQMANQPERTVGIQKSHYAGTENEYLILGLANQKKLLPHTTTTICIGILANDTSREKISWFGSGRIPSLVVGETCERCTFAQCPDRQAALNPGLDPERFDRVFKALSQLPE